MKEHDKKLRKVLDVIQEAGLKLNLKKCVWREPVVTFLGAKFSKKSVRPDPNKVKAIVEMPAPTRVHELQQIRGIITYIKMIVVTKKISEQLKKLKYKLVESCVLGQHRVFVLTRSEKAPDNRKFGEKFSMVIRELPSAMKEPKKAFGSLILAKI